MFNLTDDLMTGVDLPGPEAPWVPGEDGLPEVNPAQVVEQSMAQVAVLLQAPLSATPSKEQVAQHEANVTLAYRLLARTAALLGQHELLRRIPTMKVDQLLETTKTFAVHGSLVPKEDKNAGSGFSLNIIMPGAAAPTPVVVETSGTALPGSGNA